AGEDGPRHPTSLDGVPVEDVAGLRLDAFCHLPPARIAVERTGDVVRYALAGDDFGPGTEVDLVLGESNLAEIPRYVPRGSGRRGYVFAEVSTTARRLVLDVLVHADVYPGSAPELAVYDTSFEGVANVNDRARDADRLDVLESVQTLGRGLEVLRTPDLPRHAELLRHAFLRLGWDPSAFTAHRAAIDYPLYGTQVAISFAAPEAD
ncbi:MAG TPA: hypothetical protein VJP77_03685, partial [Planctomycetota bacterium]|nr:hypothetical protein [Planctomycetota bacterium]